MRQFSAVELRDLVNRARVMSRSYGLRWLRQQGLDPAVYERVQYVVGTERHIYMKWLKTLRALGLSISQIAMVVRCAPSTVARLLGVTRSRATRYLTPAFLAYLGELYDVYRESLYVMSPEEAAEEIDRRYMTKHEGDLK